MTDLFRMNTSLVSKSFFRLRTRDFTLCAHGASQPQDLIIKAGTHNYNFAICCDDLSHPSLLPAANTFCCVLPVLRPHISLTEFFLSVEKLDYT